MVDKNWFVNKIERNSNYGSMRGFCRKVPDEAKALKDVGALSLTFSGKRKMTIKEAVVIAKMLDVDIMEVITRVAEL